MESPSNAAPGALLKIWNYYQRVSERERESDKEKRIEKTRRYCTK